MDCMGDSLGPCGGFECEIADIDKWERGLSVRAALRVGARSRRPSRAKSQSFRRQDARALLPGAPLAAT